MIQQLKHSPLRNYAIPGLTSWLIGERRGQGGCVRLFECDRDHIEAITPHSHRFDFECLVLAGEVVNMIYKRVPPAPGRVMDEFCMSKLIYEGSPGHYRREVQDDPKRWARVDTVYKQGDRYHMRAEQVHSIRFSKGAQVLFFEGERRLDHSVILEPCVDGERVPTFKVESWMFKR